MVPSFFVGLRLAMTMTMLGVILAELYVSTAGVGYFTRVFAENYNPAPLFALVGRWRRSRSHSMPASGRRAPAEPETGERTTKLMDPQE